MVRVLLSGSVAKGSPAGRATAAVGVTAVAAAALVDAPAACCCATALIRTISHLQCRKETCQCHGSHVIMCKTVRRT